MILRRTSPANPAKPVPSRVKEAGSGTTEVVGVVVAKQVGELPHRSLATWMFPTVIPVEISALLRTKINELVVRLPLAYRHTSCLPIPPHAPSEREPTLKSLAIELPPSFTLPEKPTT